MQRPVKVYTMDMDFYILPGEVMRVREEFRNIKVIVSDVF
jgi:hypothetical protein